MPAPDPNPLHRLVASTSIALAALAATACSSRVEEALSGSIPVPAGTRVVQIRVPQGSISIEAHDRPEVVWESMTLRSGVDAAALDLLERLDLHLAVVPDDSGVLHLAVPGVPASLAGDRRNVVVARLHARVPRDLALVLETGRGPVGVTGRDADLKVTTGGGEVRLESVRGRSVVRCGNGDVLISRYSGSLDIETGTLDSGRGTIIGFVDEIGPLGVLCSTRMGAIQLHLPADAEFDLEARSVRGEVLTTWDLPAQKVGELGHVVQGRIGAGGIPVQLMTDKGNVSVRARP